MSTSFKQDTSRLSWADLCRVVAIFGVVLIHSSIDPFRRFGQMSLADWQVANFVNSVARCSVPLLVMLSGTLLLDADLSRVNQATVGQLFKRIARVALPLLSWNVAYLLYLSYHAGEPVRWFSMLSREPVYHLWFVYMIIGIYILLPVFQVIFKLILSNGSLGFYLFSLWFIVTCIPIYQPIPLLPLLQQTTLFGYGGYFLIGGVIAASRNNKVSSLNYLLVYACSVIVTFYLTLLFSQQALVGVETAYNTFSPNVFASSIVAFILISRVKIEGRFALLLRWISDRSFLVFFMHILVLERSIYATLFYLPQLPVFLEILIPASMTFFICLMLAAVIRLLPGSKTILG